MKTIKITYTQLMEAIGSEDENPFGDGDEVTNMDSDVFANHPNIDNSTYFKPTTDKDITTTPQSNWYSCRGLRLIK